MQITATHAQRQAITSEQGEILVLAGPGSGKTRTTLQRIERLLEEGADPKMMVVISFTNAAANELHNRLPTDPTAGDKIELGFIGTLHSFCLRLLKDHGEGLGYGAGISLISPESAIDLLNSKAKQLGCKTPVKDLLLLKAEGRPKRGTKLSLAQTVVASYFDDLKEAGIVDYDTLLMEVRDALTGDSKEATTFQFLVMARFMWLFVDEVQDSSAMDWQIYRALPCVYKFLVGDTDQAIYGFRGGRIAETVDYAARPSTQVIKLEENFRSRSEICDAATALIRHNKKRVDKATISTKGPGGAVHIISVANEGEEIGFVSRTIGNILATNLAADAKSQPSIAVLSYTNAIASAFRDTLKGTGIPLVDFQRAELPRDWPLARATVELLADPNNDALAYFYLVHLEEAKGAAPDAARAKAHEIRRAAAAAGRSINELSLGIIRPETPGDAMRALADVPICRESRQILADRCKEMPRASTVAEFALSIAEVRAFEQEGEGDGVRVLTIHGAKGREFDFVFLVGAEDECFPGRSKTEEGIEESRRVFFVAMTRAKSTLYISYAHSRGVTYGRHTTINERHPSRFIAEVLGKKLDS